MQMIFALVISLHKHERTDPKQKRDTAHELNVKSSGSSARRSASSQHERQFEVTVVRRRVDRDLRCSSFSHDIS